MAVPSAPLTTTGIEMPSNFPVAEYERVYARVLAKHGGGDAFRHFGGACNALSYRFRAAHDIAAEFEKHVSREGASVRQRCLRDV